MKTRLPDDYKIPDDPNTGRMDASFLRTCLRLRAKPGEEPPELPEAVRLAHYDMARSLSVLGATGPGGMNPTQLATVIALALRDPDMTKLKPVEEEKPSFMDEIKSGRATSGQKVVVNWQMKDQPAHLIERDGDKIKLLVKGNEVRFRPDLVRFPAEGEFPDVPDNLNKPVEA